MELIALGMMIPLIPYTARSFGADDLQIGLLMSIYSILQCVSSPLLGQWSDRKGKKITLILSLFFTSVSYLWFAFAPNLTHLFLSRALAGAFGVTVPTSFALMSSWTNSKQRSKNMGLIGACFGLGFIIGPALGGGLGLLKFNLPFSTVAIGACLIALIGLSIAYFNIKESRSIDESEKKESATDKWVIRTYITSIKSVLSKISIALKNNNLRFLLFLFFALSLSLTLIEAPLFLLMKDEFGWSSSMSSFGFAYIGIVLALTQGFLVRYFIPWWGERDILMWNFMIMALGFFGLCFSELRWIAVAVTFMSVGHALCYTCLTGGISLLSKVDHQGKVLGIHQSLASLSRILGPAIGGFLYRDISHKAPFIVAGVVSIFSFLLSLLYKKRIPNAGYIEKKTSKTVHLKTNQDKEYVEILFEQVKNIIEKRIPCSFVNISSQHFLKKNSNIDLLLEKCQNMTKEELLNKDFSSDHPVVIICEDGEESSLLALKLSKKYANVYYVKGGLLGIYKDDE